MLLLVAQRPSRRRSRREQRVASGDEVRAVEQSSDALAHRRPCSAKASVAAQVGQPAALAARAPRSGRRRRRAARAASALPKARLREPQLLEVRDVAEVPDDRAHQRAVNGVQRLVGERLDKQHRRVPRTARVALRDGSPRSAVTGGSRILVERSSGALEVALPGPCSQERLHGATGGPRSRTAGRPLGVRRSASRTPPSRTPRTISLVAACARVGPLASSLAELASPSPASSSSGSTRLITFQRSSVAAS